MKVKLGLHTDQRTMLILDPRAIYQGELHIDSGTRLGDKGKEAEPSKTLETKFPGR